VNGSGSRLGKEKMTHVVYNIWWDIGAQYILAATQFLHAYKMPTHVSQASHPTSCCWFTSSPPPEIILL
jgi:hypothetical protein